MEPGQRTEREITYHVGWKRGKITQNQCNRASGELTDTLQDKKVQLAADGVFGWTTRYVWRSAGAVNDRMLWIALFVLPLLVFAISLWLVYQLAIQPY